MLLNDNNDGKPDGIHLMIGRRLRTRICNPSGDQRCRITPKAGNGARLAMSSCTTRKREYGPTVPLKGCRHESPARSRRRSTRGEEKDPGGGPVISMKDD